MAFTIENGTPNIAYCHMPAQYADAAANKAVFKLSRISAFLSMENPALRDPQEATDSGAIVAHRPMKVGSMLPAEWENASTWLGLPPGTTQPNANIHFRNVTLQVTNHDFFALCATVEANNPHLLAQHDATVMITDLGEFGALLTRAHPNLLGEAHCARVKYADERPADVFTRPAYPDPFSKRLRFAPEKEVRIIWDPLCSDTAIYTHSRKAARFLKRIR